MIINKPKDRKATILGQPFLAPVAAPPPAPPKQTLPQRDTKIDAFNGIVNLSLLCRRKERDIRELEDATARGAVEDPDGQTERLIRGFAKDAQTLIDKTADGDGRALVVRAARREGMALLEEAAAARDRAGQRFIATRIKDVTDSLTAQVAANPQRLKGAREMLSDLIDAADLAPDHREMITRAASAQLTNAARSSDDHGVVTTRGENIGQPASEERDPERSIANAPQQISAIPIAASAETVTGPSGLAKLFEAAEERGAASRLVTRIGARSLGLAFGAVGAFLASTVPAGGPVAEQEFRADDGTRIHLRFAHAERLGKVTTTDTDGQRVEFTFERGQQNDVLLLLEATLVGTDGGRRTLSGGEVASALDSVSDRLRQQGVDLRFGASGDTGFLEGAGIDTTILPARKGKNKQKGKQKTQRGKRRLRGDDPPSGQKNEDLRAIRDPGSSATNAQQQRAKQLLKGRGMANKQKRRRGRRKRR